MAKEYGTSAELEPEARLAVLLAQRESLVPPVAIERLARKFADVEFADFPGDWDALSLQVKGRRARIILSSRLQPHSNRHRFTLAHELGHLLIPWSPGTVFCHADFTAHIGDGLAEALEAEANRFAGELLIPRTWVAQQLQSADAPLAALVLQAAQTAQVSPVTALLAAARVCDSGVLLAVASDDGRLVYPCSSPGSHFRIPTEWSASVEEGLLSMGASTSVAPYGDSLLIAVQFPTETPPDLSDSTLDPNELLRRILATVADTDAAQAKLRQSINGVVGAANNRLSEHPTVAQVHAVLQQRFLGRPELAQVFIHPDWPMFLGQKARELVDRRTTADGTH